MQKIALRPAIADDLSALGGEPLPFRVRAQAVEVDGELIAVGGVGYMDDGTVIAFARLTADMRRRKVQLHKAALALLRDAHARGAKQIIARVDPSVPAAQRWLERLGFAPCAGNDETLWVRQV